LNYFGEWGKISLLVETFCNFGHREYDSRYAIAENKKDLPVLSILVLGSQSPLYRKCMNAFGF
jgi:hypothetical protein